MYDRVSFYLEGGDDRDKAQAWKSPVVLSSESGFWKPGLARAKTGRLQFARVSPLPLPQPGTCMFAGPLSMAVGGLVLLQFCSRASLWLREGVWRSVCSCYMVQSIYTGGGSTRHSAGESHFV